MEQQPAATIPDREQKRKERIDDKLRRLEQNPRASVLAPRTREGHWLVNILFWYDRAMNTTRLQLGLPGFSMEKWRENAEKIKVFKKRAEELLSIMGSGYSRSFNITFFNTETAETKRILAMENSSYVFQPRSEEGTEMARYIQVFDQALLQLRTGNTDLIGDIGKAEDLFREVMKLVADFHVLTKDLCSGVRMRGDRGYRGPNGIGEVMQYLGIIKGANGGIKPGAQETGYSADA
jgi:hypothetical protein